MPPYTPFAMRTREMCWYAANKLPHALCYMPMEFRDEAMCMRAIYFHWPSVRFVPKAMQTPELMAVVARKQAITRIGKMTG